MARIYDVSKSDFTNSAIAYHNESKVGQYSKFLDKNPVFVTYYHIIPDVSRVDVGTGGVEHELGERSPIRYAKITDFPIFNMPELRPDLVYDETGADIELDLNGLTILPNTIKPLPGDHIIVQYPGTKQYLFRLNHPHYTSIQSNDFYEVDADLKDIGDDLETSRKMKGQIIAEYKTIYELIGTDDRCFVRSTEIDALQTLGKAFNDLCEMYINAFYSHVTNSFTFSTGYDEDGFPAVLYDPYLEKFIGESKIFYRENQMKTIALHPNDILQDKFEYIYSRTIYRALLDRNLMLLVPDIYSFITPVTKNFSVFNLNGIHADSVKLMLGSTSGTSSGSVNGNRCENPVWFDISKLPCCGPTWANTATGSNSYISGSFIRQLITDTLETDDYMETIIYNYIHNIKEEIDIKTLIRAIDIESIKTFYYLPMVCYILSEYYDDYFKSESTVLDGIG